MKALFGPRFMQVTRANLHTQMRVKKKANNKCCFFFLLAREKVIITRTYFDDRCFLIIVTALNLTRRYECSSNNSPLYSSARRLMKLYTSVYTFFLLDFFSLARVFYSFYCMFVTTLEAHSTVFSRIVRFSSPYKMTWKKILGHHLPSM